MTDRTVQTFSKTTLTIPDELNILADGTSAEANCGIFRIMSQKDGDKRIVWSRTSIPEIRAARKMFNDLIAEGMVPYKVGVDGNASSTVMDKFDPSAEEVIFMPIKAIRGG